MQNPQKKADLKRKYKKKQVLPVSVSLRATRLASLDFKRLLESVFSRRGISKPLIR